MKNPSRLVTLSVDDWNQLESIHPKPSMAIRMLLGSERPQGIAFTRKLQEKLRQINEISASK